MRVDHLVRRTVVLLSIALGLATLGGLACKNADTVTGPVGPATTYTVSGTVRKGAALAHGITLKISDGQAATTTAADGTFAFEHVPAGTWTLTVKTG